MMPGKTIKKTRDYNRLLVILVYLTVCFSFSTLWGQDTDTMTSGELTVKGVRLGIDPVQQTVPINTETIVNTVFSVDSPGLLENMVVKGTLRGPGINGTITLTTLPNHAFAIPGFTVKGTYTLENIRLEKEGEVLLTAEPEKAVIEAMDIIVTKVETRPLTLEEIREKGIVISEENFSVYNFSVGFIVNSEVVTYEFPIVYSGNDVYVPDSLGGGLGISTGIGGKGPIPIKFELPDLEPPDSDSEKKVATRTVSGVVLFNNDIAFLNQFFSVMFIVSNHATEGSPLTLKNLTATIQFPEGLREAETNPPHTMGTAVPVRCPGPDGKIGTADDLDIIMANFSGMAEFLAEGLKEGTHIVTIDFAGTLSGLPSGDTPISGTASGAVIVRNPEFSITFAHPAVIRKGEEYDIHVTMTNTSPVAANLVSLTMPAARLIGTILLSEETVSFEVIGPGESETAKFHMRANETGKIRASAFAAEGNVTGKFVLTAGVGEKGIPLSPDTLVLPGWAYSLPNDLMNASLMLLGEAYSIAATPPGGLPEGVPYISKALVKERAVEFAEAGQRFTYGETLVKTLEILTLDWLGSTLQDINFDILRRLTSKGIKFAAEQAKIFNQELETQTAVEFQRSFTETCSYKAPFFSAGLSFASGSRTASLRITDFYQNKLSNEEGTSGSDLIRDIPYGELYLMEDSSDSPVDFALVGHLDENGYTVEVLGETTGSFDLSLIVPDTIGGFRQVVFTNISCQPGSISTITINPADESFILTTDLDGDGQGDDQSTGNVTPVQVPAFQLLSAVQECSADAAGHATALFFNRPVDPETGTDKNNYYVEGKEVYASFLQPSGRVVLIGTNNPISPFVESKVRVENLKDITGAPLTPSPVEMPIIATIKTPGGIVYGQVLTAKGQPIAKAKIQLVEEEGYKRTLSFAVSDASGSFQFDFVRILPDPFTLEVLDPTTGKKEKVKARLMSNGQRLKLDLIMRGRGSVKGKVLTTEGSPVVNASVSARAESPGITGLSTMWEYFSAISDETGEYFITDVPVGVVSLSASHGGRHGTANTTISEPDQIRTVNITVAAGKTASVSGRVLLSNGVTPVSAAHVNFRGENDYGTRTQTDDQGFFQFPSIPIGHFTLEAFNPSTGRVGGRVTGELVENQAFNATIILRGTGRVSGKVLSHDGIPQEGVLVYLGGTSFYMDTNSLGEFDFQEVPVGHYSINAYHRTTYAQVSASVEVLIEGQHVHTTLVFPNTLKGGITGTVYDVNGVTPLPYMNVFVCDGNYIVKGSARSDVSGSFQVANFSPGNYIVFVPKTGAAGTANTTVQFPGHLAQCNVQCRGQGKVIINVLAADGQTGVMANVDFSRLIFKMSEGDYIGFLGDEKQYTTDENGHLEIDEIYLGYISVTTRNAFYPRGASFYGQLTTPGQELTIDLVMRPTGKVIGKVVSYDGVTTVADARVDFRAGGLPEQTLYTDDNGEFEFTLVPPGYFQLKAEDTINGLKGSRSGTMGEDGDVVDVTVRLLGRGQVNGTVKDRSEELIPNAKVTLNNIGFPGEKFATNSDENGHFVFSNVSEGKFSVTVYDPVSHTGGRTQGDMPGHSAQVEVTVYLDPSGTVSGRVLSPDGNNEMIDVQVVLLHSRFGYGAVGYFYVSEPGGFLFENVPSGALALEVLHPASGRKGKAYGNLDTQDQQVVMDIRLEGRGTVTGTFFDGSRVNPIANAGIKIRSKGKFPFDLVSSTDAEGNFTFEQVGQGEFDLEATDPSTGLTGSASGEIEYDEQTVYINVYARGSGSVTGTVLRADGTTPAPDSRISLKQGSKTFSAYADASGHYRVDFVPVGSFTVSAYEQPGERDYGSGAGQVEFHGQEAVVDITFKGLGIVKGQVLDGAGNPIPDITVNILSNNESFTTSSDSSGAYSFDALRMGPFSIEARDPVTKLSGTGDGELTADGQMVTIDLTLESAGSVIGRILDADGTTPAENAYLKLKGSNFTKYYFTGSSGEFQFNAVRLGSFSLEAAGFNNSGKARLYDQLDTHGDIVDFSDIVLDNAAPEVTGFTPANGSSLVPLNTFITVRFSEAMSASTINTSSIKLSSPPGNVAGSVVLSQDLKSVVFTPSVLLSGFAIYTLVVDDVVEDAAGNQLGTPVSSSFTTSDIEPPVLVSVEPAHNAAGVPINALITVTFNEPIDPTYFSTQNLVLSKGGTPIAGTIGFNDSKMSAIFTPVVLETDSVYSAVVQGARDFAGNVQASAFSWVFSTIDTTAPTVQLVPPGQGTTVIEGSTVQLSADIGASTDVAAVHFFINGDLKHTDHSAPYTFQFTAPLLDQTTGATFLVQAMAVDQAGNQSPRDNLTFTLLSDSPPQVTLTGPAAPRVYPGGTISCSVSAADDVGLTRVTLTASGGTMQYSDTRTFSTQQTAFSKNYNIIVPADILPGTEIILHAEAEDLQGNVVSAANIILQVPQDEQNPVVTINLPLEGAHFKHNQVVQISAQASDDVGLKEIRIYLDDQLLETYTQTQDLYTASYTVPPLDDDTPAVVKVEAEDLSGKVSQDSVNILLEKLIDITAPVAKILSPSDGSLVFAGENLEIKVEATDDEGVDRVEIYVDDQLFTTLTQGPYEADYPVPAGAAAGSTITIKATAIDVDNKTGTDQVTVEVSTGTFLPAGTVIEADNTDFDNQTIIINDGTVTINGAHTFLNVLVKENGVLTHSGATSSTVQHMQLTIIGKLVIGANAKIAVGGRGYLGGRQGDNNSDYGRTLGNTTSGGSGFRSGGSHGGYGGKYSNNALGQVYGSIDLPCEPGSGGGGNYWNRGGNGGGVISIEVVELLLDGGIYANGGNTSEAGGGGSGGSILLNVTTLKGSGTVTANGGNSKHSAGGGGGRIALYYETASEFNLANITAYGGLFTNGTTSTMYGSAGTVYLNQTGQEAQLIIDNRDNRSYNPRIFPSIGPSTSTGLSAHVLTDANASYMPGSLKGMKLVPNLNDKDQTFTIIDNTKTTITTDAADGDLTTAAAIGDTYGGIALFTGHLQVQHTYIAEINGDARLNNLSVLESSRLSHPAASSGKTYYLSLHVPGRVYVDNTSWIAVGGRGYLGGRQGDNGSDYGRTLGNTTSGGSGFRSGGSHGGYGGKYSDNAVNQVYGSIYLPIDAGSGGGGNSWNRGGNGGGVLYLESGELLLDGGIGANGSSTNEAGGGGSGGSIQLNVTTLKGSGTVTANGGNSLHSAGGSGGRIAVYYQDASQFDLTKITAYGGIYTNSSNSTWNAGAGTIYLEKKGQTGEIIVDNNAIDSSNGTRLLGGTSGTITALDAHHLVDDNANFTPGSLIGMQLIPNLQREEHFTIVANSKREIFTAAADGDMTLVAAVGDSYGFKYPGRFVLDSSQTIINGSFNFPEITLLDAELTANGTLAVDRLTLQNGSLITHSTATTTTTYSLNIKANEIVIEENSRVAVGGRGYLGGSQGDNSSDYGRTLGNTTSGGSDYGSGGSYGGYGGKYSTRALNQVYGSIDMPFDPGSGGGGNYWNRGGNGGGVLSIEAGELLLDGGIYANGGGGSDYGGGGSGGSIQLKITTLKGSGSVYANGGNSRYRAGGGGGRIALYYETAAEFNLTNITAYGGLYTNSTSYSQNGSAGTVYLRQTGQEAQLIIDNRDNRSYNPLIFPAVGSSTITDLSAQVLTDATASYMPGSLKGMKLMPNMNDKDQTFTIIDNTKTTITTDAADGDLTTAAAIGDTYGGIFVFAGHLQVQHTYIAEINGDARLNNLSVLESSRLSHPAASSGKTYYLSLHVPGRVYVDNTSMIAVGARGYLGGRQGDNSNDYGRTLGNTTNGGSGYGSGGSYGGYGGKYSTSAVNQVYGSIYLPIDAGSGGGGNYWNRGGNGGGVLYLESGELLLDGGIGANGGSSSNYGGGGSGGSIQLKVTTLKGSGSVYANGGNSRYRAGGGGGRIAVYYQDASQFDLSQITAYGGTYTNGTDTTWNAGAGTIYLKKSSLTFGDLVVNNNGNATAQNSTTLPAVGQGFNTLLEANRMVNSAASFIPGALTGIKLNPQPVGNIVFTIIKNNGTEIFTSPEDGDMTQVGVTGGAYIGEHHLYNLTVKGSAHVFTLDRVQVSGTITVEPGSTLKAENYE